MTKSDFSFEGRTIAFDNGHTLAAALTDAGERHFRDTAKGGERGIFCGMGVCQDCLLTVDGRPNQRACMTKATPGMKVTRQAALPALEVAPQQAETQTPELIEVDVAILGGGAAGLSAAIAARAAGASVLLLDERKTSGGQYYKQAVSDIPALDPQQHEGAELVEQAASSGARILSGAETWGAFDGPLLLAEVDERAIAVRPKALIVATGAYERPVMVPGWTLPGVMTTGAAQTLWRSYRTTPGDRILICGSGPLNAQVAAELADAGCDIAAILDTTQPASRRLADAAAMAIADPKLTAKGMGLLARLKRRGIPVRYQSGLLRIEQDGHRLRTVFKTANGQEKAEVVDAICMNDGFHPQNEALRLLGAEMTFDTRYGHLRCTRDRAMATTVPGLFAAGDCAGLGGAPAARIEGSIAGRAAAGFCHGSDVAGATAAEERLLSRHRRFQHHLWQVYDPGPHDIDDIPRDTVICRCEEITLAEAEDALDAETGHLGTLKRASRIGMGRCQGRYCGPVAARLVARRTDRPIEDFSFFAPRVPIKPIAISAILAAEEVCVVTKTDVLVIGGGIVGQVAAIEIAASGARVIVVDAGRDTGSTANAGSLHVQMQSRFMRMYPDQVPALEASLPLYCAAVEEWDRLDARLGPFGMVRKGGLMLAETVEQMDFLSAKAEREDRAGVDVEMLNRDALDAIAPWLGPHIVGAELCRNEGKLDPLTANLRLRGEAERLGVRFIQDQITSLNQHGEQAIATGMSDTWQADRILLAAAWGAGSLLKDLGLDMPTKPEPLHMNISEPCAAQIGHLVQHAERSITLKQFAGGQVVIGGGWPADIRGSRQAPGVRSSSLIGNVALAARLAPAIGNLRILRTWAGINTTIDGASTVGPVPNANRIVVAVPGDAGYTLGPLVAKMAASFVTGNDHPMDPGRFSPARFAA